MKKSHEEDIDDGITEEEFEQIMKTPPMSVKDKLGITPEPGGEDYFADLDEMFGTDDELEVTLDLVVEDEVLDAEPEPAPVLTKPAQTKPSTPRPAQTKPQETNAVSALYLALNEQIGIDINEEDAPDTAEGLVSYLADLVDKASVPTYASEEIRQLDEYVKNGGNLKSFLNTYKSVDIEEMDLKIESNQEAVVKEFLKAKGFSEQQINKKVARYKDTEMLEDEAEEARLELISLREKQKEATLIQQRLDREQRVREQNQFQESVWKLINNLKDVRGIAISQKDKGALVDYLFKFDSNGQSAYQRDYYSNVKNLIESAYFTMRGDKLIKAAANEGQTKAMKTLKQSLKTGSVGRGTQAVPTKSGLSVWDLAARSLGK